MGSVSFKPILTKVNISVMPTIGSCKGGSAVSGGGTVSGGGSITGKVLENGLPVSRRVMLYERKTGAYAGQVRSNADGVYTFKRTNEALLYFVVSVDDNSDGVQYNLVGQDLISGNHDKRTAT